MRHLDLCSGIGGFSLASHWLGWETVAFSEIEEYACKILKRHWPDVPNLGDLREVNSQHGWPRADIITGGFPCQPWSVSGKQRGTEDERHLWPSMCETIAQVRPSWVVCENVYGLVRLGLDQVQHDLEGIG